jgi:hypothetical protein
MATSHKSADCIAEVAGLKNKGSLKTANEKWKDYLDAVERISPNLSCGDAEEMFYLIMQEMYTHDGFLERVERIYNTVMARNYNW